MALFGYKYGFIWKRKKPQINKYNDRKGSQQSNDTITDNLNPARYVKRLISLRRRLIMEAVRKGSGKLQDLNS